MSVIGKKPFVDSIFSSLDETEMGTLKSLMNELGTATKVDLFGPNIITSSNIGVTHVLMGLEEFSGMRYDGILCYHDASHCALFVINDSLNEMQAFEINPTAKTYHQVYEHLTAEEFRQSADDTAEHGGDEWVETMKTKLTWDNSGKQIVSAKKIHIEGQDAGGIGLAVDEKCEFNENIDINSSFLNLKDSQINVYSGATNVGTINYITSDNILDIHTGNSLKLQGATTVELSCTAIGTLDLLSNNGTLNINSGSGNLNINGIRFPAYPNDTTKTYTLQLKPNAGGTALELAWVEVA